LNAPIRVGHEDVDLVSFTGGTATGKIVGATAASSFKKLSLELGGKNATIGIETDLSCINMRA
jgi:acyl-CoA reductase-like NAD-dependent aldehyde dehydrogenase